MSSDLAVLITSHNRKAKSIACLQSLYSQNIAFETYFVDDGSTDGTTQAVNENFPQVKIIQGNGNLYWNRGMLLAWETAVKEKERDFYLWLNDDVELAPNAIKKLLETSKEFKDKNIIVGTCNSMETHILTYGGYLKSVSWKQEPILAVEKPKECRCFGGNIILVPKSVYEKIGMLDKIFHHAIGDFDYGLRSQRFGIKSYVAVGILGMCLIGNEKELICYDENKSFNKRLKCFLSPIVLSFKEHIVFGIRHKCLLNSFFYYIICWFHFLFPKFYKRVKGEK